MSGTGLLCGHADLRVLSLALRDCPDRGFPALRRAAAASALADDSRALAALSALYDSRARASVPSAFLQSGGAPALAQPPHTHPSAGYHSPVHAAAASPPPSLASPLVVSQTSAPARGALYSVSRAERDVARGHLVLFVPHLRLPWAADLAAVLWRRLGVRLERRMASQRRPTDFSVTLSALQAVSADTPLVSQQNSNPVAGVPDSAAPATGTGVSGSSTVASTCSSSARHEYIPATNQELLRETRQGVALSSPAPNADLDALADHFYPPLPLDDQQYNAVVLAHLERTHGEGVVAKLANLVRLSYVNGVLADIRRQIVSAAGQRDEIQQALTAASIRIEGTPCLARPSTRLASSPSLPSRMYSRAPRPQHRVRVVATLVPGLLGVHANASRVSRAGARAVAGTAAGDFPGITRSTGSGCPHGGGPDENAKYIICGCVVPGDLLLGVCNALARDYGVRVIEQGQAWDTDAEIASGTDADNEAEIEYAKASVHSPGPGSSACVSDSPSPGCSHLMTDPVSAVFAKHRARPTAPRLGRMGGSMAGTPTSTSNPAWCRSFARDCRLSDEARDLRPTWPERERSKEGDAYGRTAQRDSKQSESRRCIPGDNCGMKSRPANGIPARCASYPVLDAYLIDHYGIPWARVCERVMEIARLEQMRTRLEELENVIEASNRAEDATKTIRADLVRAAVAFEVANAPLSEMCALRIAQVYSDPEINAMYMNLPREVWGLVDTARNRLEELENTELVSLQSAVVL